MYITKMRAVPAISTNISYEQIPKDGEGAAAGAAEAAAEAARAEAGAEADKALVCIDQVFCN